VGRIYKILSRAEWRAAQVAGTFEGSAIDHADGFIHFSTAVQVAETARRHFAGQPDLVVLEIKAADLGAGLVWEPSRGGDLFPHLYGALSADKVLVVHEAPLDADGVPTMSGLS
jgi:uncharacterized protein (DUF952 family)